jgi:hypothetical protein
MRTCLPNFPKIDKIALSFHRFVEKKNLVRRSAVKKQPGGAESLVQRSSVGVALFSERKKIGNIEN